MHNQPREPQLMRIVKQNRFKNLGELHKKWTEAGVKKKKKKNWTVAQWSKVLFSDESKFCISFGNQGPRLWRKGGEAHSPSCLKSSVKFPQSVMICGAMSSAGVGPLCFLKTVYQDILEKMIFLLLTGFLKMLISFSSRIWHLPTLPNAPKVG